MNSRAVIAGWVCSIVASPFFVDTSYFMLSGDPAEIAGFRFFGLPVWSMYAVAIVQVTGVALFLFSRRMLLGAAMLAAVAAGAAAELAAHGRIASASVPLAFAALVLAGAAARSPKRRRH